VIVNTVTIQVLFENVYALQATLEAAGECLAFYAWFVEQAAEAGFCFSLDAC
jgi:hypothetical protein